MRMSPIPHFISPVFVDCVSLLRVRRVSNVRGILVWVVQFIHQNKNPTKSNYLAPHTLKLEFDSNPLISYDC